MKSHKLQSMDEERLTKDIEQYKEQFLQVQNVLNVTGEEGQEELVKLRDDLVELIHVSEESLLSLKKSRLLQMIDDQETSQPSTSNELETELNNELDDINDQEVGEEDVIGTKCRVSYTQEWGLSQHHNAMVFSVEIPDDDDDQTNSDKAKVRVLFLNPTHISMVPCPYFLDGKCRFDADECRYSHGYLLDIDHLKPFREPNFSDIKEGQQCLARYNDGVWYKATIKSFKQEEQEFLVHYDTYNTDCTLGMDAVFPLDEVDSPDDSDDDDTSSLSSSSLSTDVTIDDKDLILEWKPTGTSMGDWEQHTRGIGSKLMAKMGYIFGKGLGKDSDGRVDPVEVVVLPQGKSLDVCAELREKKKLKEPFKKKKKSLAEQTKTIHKKEGTVNDVFAFINHKLGNSKGNIQDIRASLPTSNQFDIKDRRRKKVENDKNTNWNIKLFKIHEEIAAAEKQLKRKKQAHQRQSMDKSTGSFFKRKVEDMEHHITQLKENEKIIKQKIHQKDQHRKLTVF